MAIVDVAGDWKCVNADRLEPVGVRQVDPDLGPQDDDTIALEVPALQYGTREAPVAIEGGEVSETSCKFEFAKADVGFSIWQRCRVTDRDGVVWALDSVDLDAGGSIYQCEATRTRG